MVRASDVGGKLASLWHQKTSARSAWFGVVIASCLSCFGMLFELWLELPIPGIPLYPASVSSALGAATLIVLLLRRLHTTVRHASFYFLMNTAFMIWAFYLTNPYYLAAFGERWTPFQGFKLGVLLAPLIAPSFSVGLLAILGYSSAAVIQYASFPADLQQKIAYGEPSLSIVFGICASLMLYYRFHSSQIEREMLQKEAETQSLKRWARAQIHLRDLTNTPIQSIEFALALRCDYGVQDPKIDQQMREAVRELRAIDAKLAAWDYLFNEDKSLDP